MKPLSERLKDFPNGQFVDWLCLACVDVREVTAPDDAQEEINKIRDAVAERLASLEQRAEAAEAALERESDIHIDTLASMREWRLRAEEAEAQLAELAKQEPSALRWRFEHGRDLPAMAWTYIDNKKYFDDVRGMEGAEIEDVFTRPAHAAVPVDLLSLVPPAMEAWKVKLDPHGAAVWDACCAEMLRRIEGLK